MLDLALSLVGLSIPAGILLPFGLAYYAIFRWEGRWRVAAIIPLLVVLVFFAPLAVIWYRDPTGGNLWGLIFIPVGFVLCIYSLVLILMRRRYSNAAGGTRNPHFEPEVKTRYTLR